MNDAEKANKVLADYRDTLLAVSNAWVSLAALLVEKGIVTDDEITRRLDQHAHAYVLTDKPAAARYTRLMADQFRVGDIDKLA